MINVKQELNFFQIPLVLESMTWIRWETYRSHIEWETLRSLQMIGNMYSSVFLHLYIKITVFWCSNNPQCLACVKSKITNKIKFNYQIVLRLTMFCCLSINPKITILNGMWKPKSVGWSSICIGGIGWKFYWPVGLPILRNGILRK